MDDLKTAWAETKTILRRQMTQATYDSVIQKTDLVGLEDGCYIIHAETDLVREWLAERLSEMVATALAKALQLEEVQVHFVNGTHIAPAAEQSEREQLLFNLERDAILGFDPEEHGYSPLYHYVQQFWGAWLGAPPMQLLNYVRSFYKLPRYVYDSQAKGYVVNPEWTPWTPARRFRASDLARSIESRAKKKPNLRKITGGYRTCHRYDEAYQNGEIWPCCQCIEDDGQPRGSMTMAGPSKTYPEGRQVCRYWAEGILEHLEREGVLLYERVTGGHIRNIYYNVQVYIPLPLLSPAQVMQMNIATQTEHAEFLDSHKLNRKAWQSFSDESLMPLVVSWLGATIETS